MEKSDDLYYLIKSLSKQEKRYFKIYISKFRKKNNCVLLYNILNNQKEYNEDEIREKFKTEAFIKELHVTKNYLYSLILKSLFSYHSNLTSSFKIKNLINYAQILFHKGLYKQSKKLLIKAKFLATHFENYYALLEIIYWQSKIAYNETIPSELKKYILKDSIEELSTIEKLKEKYYYRKGFFEIIHLNNLGLPARDLLTYKKYNDIIDNEYFKNENTANTFYTKLLFNIVMSYYYFNLDEIRKSFVFCNKATQLMEENPIQIKENRELYVAVLNNTAYSASQLKEKEICIDAINKLKNISKYYLLSNDLSSNFDDKVFIRTSFLEMNLYIEIGEFDESLKLFNEIRNRLASIENKFDFTFRYKLFLYFNISYTFFGVKDFKNALVWNNKILNSKVTKDPLDLFCFARILNYIIHFELKNNDVIENINNSNMRFFKKNNRLYEFENTVFNFFRKELNNTYNIIDIDSIKKVRMHLEKIITNLKDFKSIQYFDLISWLDCKIYNTSFAEIKKLKNEIIIFT